MILDPSGSSDSSVKAKNSTVILVLALVVGAFLGVRAVSLVSRFDLGRWGRFWSAVSGISASLDVSQPAVVSRIQQLQKLETVVYTMDKVVTGERDNPLFPDFLAGDRLLLLVHGEVIAGIDFSTVQNTNVSVTGKNVRLRLPYPQIFVTRLDNAKTRVYSRQTGLLVPVDPNLETKVRQEAERQIREAALADGILKTAQQNARSTIIGMLRGLGFESIDLD